MSPITAFDPKALRQALGTFTTGVTIITTRAADGEPLGLTANSFNSVSLDPPMVLWSLAKSSRNLAAFEAAEHWAVHILSIEQEALSDRFAKSGEDKFAGVPIDMGIGNVPLLHGCTTRLQCKTSFKYEGGDHIIFVGEVLDFDRGDDPPLVFQAGSYAIATRKPASSLAQSPMGISFGEDYLGFLLMRVQHELHDRVSVVQSQQALDDEEFFLLPYLMTRGGQTLAEINQAFGLVDKRIEPDHVAALIERGLLMTGPGEHGQARLQVTDRGRDMTLHVLAAVKAIESELLSRLSSWEILSVKNSLKRLVQMPEAGS